MLKYDIYHKTYTGHGGPCRPGGVKGQNRYRFFVFGKNSVIWDREDEAIPANKIPGWRRM